MEWHDEGIILHTQNLGERKQVVSLFTRTHGRCAGIFRENSRTKAWIQCGGKVKARWGARLENHMGLWTFEPLTPHTAFFLDKPGPLAALLSATSLCHIALPERHAYPSLYTKFEDLLGTLSTPSWICAYIFFEFSLLEELGYGLDLKTCAVTGTTANLVAVSPRTGRAVCEEVAKPYQGRLLPLPPFIHEKNNNHSLEKGDVLNALHLTGYFLERHLLGRSVPPARERLVERFSKGKE